MICVAALCAGAAQLSAPASVETAESVETAASVETTASVTTAASARLERIEAREGNEFVLRGTAFGSVCATCEVIGTYRGGLRYALTPLEWSETRVVVRAPDLNLGEHVSVRVRASQSESNSLSLRLDARIARAWSRQFSSATAAGDRGEETFAVSTPEPACDRKRWIFDHARIAHLQRRFGEAQIARRPASPCARCSPLTVRWYHEPAGRVQFEVQVFVREVEGVCAARRR